MLIVTSVSDPLNWVGFQFRKGAEADDITVSGYTVYLRDNGGVDLYKAGVGVVAATCVQPDGTCTESYLSGTWHVSARGGRIRVSVDGTAMIDHTDPSPMTTGYAGFRSHFVAASVDELEVTDTKAVYYVRGAGGEVLAEYNGGTTPTAEYAYGGGQRVAVLKPLAGGAKGVSYYFNDHLGSARVVWDGTVKQATEYYPYGEVEAQTGSEGESRFGFTGHETDFATDLIYAGARYYDAEVGRWLQSDPLASLFPSRSSYNYALNNPLSYTDPTGMSPDCGQEGQPPCPGGDLPEIVPRDMPSTDAPSSEYISAGDFELRPPRSAVNEFLMPLVSLDVAALTKMMTHTNVVEGLDKMAGVAGKLSKFGKVIGVYTVANDVYVMIEEPGLGSITILVYDAAMLPTGLVGAAVDATFTMTGTKESVRSYLNNLPVNHHGRTFLDTQAQTKF